MKKFAFKLLNFGLIGLIFVFLSLIFVFIIQKKVNSDSQKIAGYQNLIMGDSQMQRLNSNLFPFKTKNIASSGEHFYFTYQKLKCIIQNKNNKVQKVVLGLSIHHFSPVYNRLFDTKFSEGQSSLKRFLYFIPISYYNEFVTLSGTSASNFIKGLFLKGADWGGEVKSDYSNPDEKSIKNLYESHFLINQSEEKYSQSQKKYLRKIDSLCLSNDIKLITCSLPYLSLYKKKINNDYFEFYNNAVSDLKRLNHINFISEIPKSNWMSDGVHLNNDGGAIYSKKINKIITNLK